MSPHFYVKSLILLPPWKWWVARKKSADPILHTLFMPYIVQVYYALLIPPSIGVSQFLSQYNKYIFEKTIPTISVCDLLDVGTCTDFRHVTRKGKWPLHLRPDTNLCVLLEHLAFEDGWVPCNGKMVSTRAHIREVQAYSRKTTLQVELCN